MSRARRKSRLSRKINIAAMVVGVTVTVAGVILRDPAGIIAGIAATGIGAAGTYRTRRKS